ncbi:MAG: FAD-dependent oxidoreductase [Hyphomicrobiales bacterium]
MNVGDELTLSCWMAETPVIAASPLDADITCDVVVIGSGIAGLSTAYELTRFGRDVVVIDRAGIGTGMTARTTAHLASEIDDYYHTLVGVHGEDRARHYYESQVASINRIEAICRDEQIDADFLRLSGFLFAAEESHRDILEREYECCAALGVSVAWADAPLPAGGNVSALRFSNQARLHPTKYLRGLAHGIARRDGRFFRDTPYVSHTEKDGRVEITTEVGPKIRATFAVFATNSPVNELAGVNARQQPFRTYVVAGPVPKGTVIDALLWDTEEPYHYVRLQPLSETEDLLIVGGEDHRTGEEDDMEERLMRLERWTRQRFPAFNTVTFRWSGQVMEPNDFLPFSGRAASGSNVFVHSGDSGQGITNGVAGSLTLLPLILGEDSRFASLFEPNRSQLKSLTSAREFAQTQAGAVKNYAEYLSGGEISSVDELSPGEGAILREGLEKYAVYRHPDGAVSKHSAACTHMGCIVHWNPLELCWDCPCHGSQFAPDGEVLNGPATQPLADADSEAPAEAEAHVAP